MSTKTTKKNKTAKKRGTEPRAQSKRVAAAKPAPAAILLTVSGTFPAVEAARRAYQELKRAGFAENAISASTIRPVEVLEERAAEPVQAGAAAAQGYGMGAARIAGSMLALGSVPLLAPLLVGGPLLAAVFGMGESYREEREPTRPERPVLLVATCVGRAAANRARRIFESCGATQVAAGDLREGADLEIREYRDELGEIHHHTRTYMRDHASQTA